MRFFRPYQKHRVLTLLSFIGVMGLVACDFGGGKTQSQSQWNELAAQNGFYEEERTAGMGLRRVLSQMAPIKEAVLKAMSDVTSPDLLPEAPAAPLLKNKSDQPVSKRIPLEYGELNFFSTRPNRGRDLHITEERPAMPVMAREIQITKAKSSAPTETIDIKSTPEPFAGKPTEKTQAPAPIKKADFLFNEFAKMSK